MACGRWGACVVIVLSGEKSVSISSDYAFEVATVHIEEQAFQHGKQRFVVFRIVVTVPSILQEV